jgi:hypothetical protein
LAVLKGALTEAAVITDLTRAALGVVAALNRGQLDEASHVGFAVGGEAARDFLIEINRDGPFAAVLIDIKTAHNTGQIRLTQAIEAAIHTCRGESIAAKAAARTLELAQRAARVALLTGIKTAGYLDRRERGQVGPTTTAVKLLHTSPDAVGVDVASIGEAVCEANLRCSAGFVGSTNKRRRGAEGAGFLREVGLIAPRLETARDLHIRGRRSGTAASAVEGHAGRDAAGVQVEGAVA